MSVPDGGSKTMERNLFSSSTRPATNSLGTSMYHQNHSNMEQLEYQDGSLLLGSTSPYGTLMQYPSFQATDGLWSALEPAFLSSFGYATPNTGLIPTQQLQNPFYFPSTDLIWSQDPQLMSYLTVEQQQQQQLASSSLGLDVTGAGSIDHAAASLGQTFSTMTLNGSVPSVLPVSQPTILPVALSGAELVVVETLNQTQGSTTAGNTQGQSAAPHPEKPKSWAAIASQPAKPKPAPPKLAPPAPTEATANGEGQQAKKTGASSGSRSGSLQLGRLQAGGSVALPRGAGNGSSVASDFPAPASSGISNVSSKRGAGAPQPLMAKQKVHCDIVEQLKAQNKYNPTELTLSLTNARYFVIKSYAEDDIHRSIKYNIWTSTEHGNRRLDTAFQEQKGKGNVYLLFSVNGSGHFCGLAQMVSEVDFNSVTGVWTQEKWKGRFDVKWIYVKDVPNSQLRHIRLENNENKPVTNSRDTQEVPPEKGKQVVKIFHNYHHTTSIFDDFEHYENKEQRGVLDSEKEEPTITS